MGLELKPMGLQEYFRYIRLIAILLQLTNDQSSKLFELGERLKQLWNKSGVLFLIQYLSECLRMVGNFLAGKGSYNKSIWVKHYKNGLPKILGLELKHSLENLKYSLENDISPLPMHRAIISVLSSFRALSPLKWIPKFSTVTDPFKGISESLDSSTIKKALKAMGAIDFFNNKKLNTPIFFWSSKSGVNARFAYLSAGLDLIAIMRNPRIWLGHLKFAYHFSFFHYMIVFLILSLLFIPFLLWPIDLYLGRLALIKELRGKTRIIGITDQWTQWLFRPLHDAIYDFLGTLAEDGTNDQLKPVRLMLEKNKNSQFYSLDLSAATDRLPVSLQKDILNCLGLCGTEWKNILNRPYYYMGVPFHYSVGQPMGAYSSFAMLALANHLIVYCAALQEGIPLPIKDLGSYGIIGDDIVISNDRLAHSYNKIMNDVLGVVINPIKGFEGNIIEFAKSWFHSSGVNLTPLGSKSILRSIRNPLYITSVIADYNFKEYNSILKLELSVLIKLLDKIHNKVGLAQWKWLFSIIGPQGGFWRLSSNNLDVKSMEYLFKEFLSLYPKVPFTSVTEYYYNTLVKKSWTPTRSFTDLFKSYSKLFKFIIFPLIWTNKKLESLRLNKQYSALLTGATVSVLSVPLLLLAFLRAVRVWIVLWILSGVGVLLGFPYISKTFHWKVSEWRNTLNRMIHNFFLNWELVKAGKAKPSPITLYEKPKRPIPRVLNSSLLFSRWMLGLKLNRPVQLLVDRVKVRSEDELPAVKTAEKVLSSLNRDYNRFNQKVKSELKRIQKLKKSKRKGRK